jgi:hypothetical protein
MPHPPQREGEEAFLPDVSAVPTMGRRYIPSASAVGPVRAAHPRAWAAADVGLVRNRASGAVEFRGEAASPDLAAVGAVARHRLVAGARALGRVARSTASATGLVDSSEGDSDEYEDDSYSQDSLSADGSTLGNFRGARARAKAASGPTSPPATDEASASPPLVFATTFSDFEIAALDAPAAQAAKRPQAQRHDSVAPNYPGAGELSPHSPLRSPGAQVPDARAKGDGGQLATRPSYQDPPVSSLLRLPEAGLDASPPSPSALSPRWSEGDSQEGSAYMLTLSPMRRETQAIGPTPSGLMQKPHLKPAILEPVTAPPNESLHARLLHPDQMGDQARDLSGTRKKLVSPPLLSVLLLFALYLCVGVWGCAVLLTACVSAHVYMRTCVSLHMFTCARASILVCTHAHTHSLTLTHPHTGTLTKKGRHDTSGADTDAGDGIRGHPRRGTLQERGGK